MNIIATAARTPTPTEKETPYFIAEPLVCPEHDPSKQIDFFTFSVQDKTHLFIEIEEEEEVFLSTAKLLNGNVAFIHTYRVQL